MFIVPSHLLKVSNLDQIASAVYVIHAPVVELVYQPLKLSRRMARVFVYLFFLCHRHFFSGDSVAMSHGVPLAFEVSRSNIVGL